MEPFQHAIIGFGRGDADRSVVALAARVGAALNISRYTLAHVLRSSDLPHEVAGKLNPQQFREQILDLMEAAEQAETAWPADAQIEHLVLAGVAGDQLVRLAAQEKSDLVVVGRQRHKPQSTLGLAAGRLVHYCPCSILVAPHKAPAALNRILVPIDFSSHAADALDVAEQIAATTRAEVVAQHVYRVPPGFEAASASAEDFAATLLANAERRWAEFVAERRHSTPPPAIRFDLIAPADADSKPADAVVRVAEEIAADLIVCGGHGHTGLKRLLLGSTSEGILKRTERAVLCVKRKSENIGLLKALFGEGW